MFFSKVLVFFFYVFLWFLRGLSGFSMFFSKVLVFFSMFFYGF